MAGGRKKVATATPEHQESGDEGEESEVEDQEDSTVFLHKRVDNLDTKINKVLVVLGKLTKESSAPGNIITISSGSSRRAINSGQAV